MPLTARAALQPLIGIVLAALLPGCALQHDQIAPAPINPAAYTQASCVELAQMRAKTNRSLIFAEIAQDKRYEDDRTPTFGIPTPMALIFEPRGEAQVARLKGDSLALAAQLERADCMRDHP